MKYYVIAGEASGDLYASDLVRALQSLDPASEIRFRGSDAATAVMGGVELLGSARRIGVRLAACKREIRDWRPDVVILVDYPGFNLRVARYAKAQGRKVAWYIAPKVWAHRAGRVRALRRNVDALYCVFPFEPAWFRAHGIEPRYFGNPLVDSLAGTSFAPVGEGKMIALLAGSREMELDFLLPRFVKLAALLRADPRLSGYRLVLAAAPSLPHAAYERRIPGGTGIEVLSGRTRDILHQADAAVVCSGTASLEAALLGTPQVVCYGLHPLTFAIAKRTVKVPYASLVNLVLDRPAVPELLQRDASPEKMRQALEQLLLDTSCREKMAADYKELKHVLGDAGATARTAKDMYETFARI